MTEEFDPERTPFQMRGMAEALLNDAYQKLVLVLFKRESGYSESDDPFNEEARTQIMNAFGALVKYRKKNQEKQAHMESIAARQGDEEMAPHVQIEYHQEEFNNVAELADSILKVRELPHAYRQNLRAAIADMAKALSENGIRTDLLAFGKGSSPG